MEENRIILNDLSNDNDISNITKKLINNFNNQQKSQDNNKTMEMKINHSSLDEYKSISNKNERENLDNGLPAIEATESHQSYHPIIQVERISNLSNLNENNEQKNLNSIKVREKKLIDLSFVEKETKLPIDTKFIDNRFNQTGRENNNGIFYS